MYQPYFINFVPAEAIPDSIKSDVFDALFGAQKRAEEGMFAFLTALKDRLPEFGFDPLHRVWAGILFDIMSRFRRDMDLCRNLDVKNIMHYALASLEKVRSQSLAASHSLSHEYVEYPDTWQDYVRLHPEQRLALQGYVVREAEQDFSIRAAERLAASLRRGKQNYRRVLNVSDRFDPTWAARQTFVGNALAKALLRWGIEIEEIHCVDIVAKVGTELDQQRHDILRQTYGPNGTPNSLRTHRMDVRALEFEDSRFDAVLSHGVLDHLVGHSYAMSELLRVAQPGAPVAISGHHIANIKEHWFYSIGNEAHFNLATGRPTSASGMSLRKWSKAQGFCIKGFESWPHAWSLELEKNEV